MRRRVGLVVAIAALAIGSAIAGVESAMSAFKAGRYHEAAAQFQALVEESPGYDFGWFMLGHSLVKMRRPAEAEAMFRRARQLAPNRADYHHGLAIALRDEGRFQAAVKVLDAAEPLASEPRAIFALMALRGFLHVKLGAWQPAVVDLERACRIRPDPDSLELLGQAYLGLMNLEKAAAALRGALAVQPARPVAMQLLAETLLIQGQTADEPRRKQELYGEALSRAEQLVVLRPEAPEALNLLGRAALGAGQLDVAEASFERVLEKDPRQCYVMVNLARVRIARAAWENAEALLAKAAACAPRLGVVYETLGNVYLREERWKEAAEAFRRASRLQPSPYAEAGLAEAMRRLEGDVRPVGR